MATYILQGRYTPDAVKSITAGRTDKARALIQKQGGKLHAMYALLGEHDLLLIADLPDTASALKTSLGLAKLTGIGFTTSPALDIADFDKLAAGA